MGDPGGNLIIDAAGNIFGTALNGGANNGGTVWELPVGSSTITALGSFARVSQGGRGTSWGTLAASPLAGTTVGQPCPAGASPDAPISAPSTEARTSCSSSASALPGTWK